MGVMGGKAGQDFREVLTNVRKSCRGLAQPRKESRAFDITYMYRYIDSFALKPIGQWCCSQY